MKRKTGQSALLFAPVAVLAFAALPLVATPEVAATPFATGSRIAMTTDRAESWARCVSQVVKRLCNTQPAVAHSASIGHEIDGCEHMEPTQGDETPCMPASVLLEQLTNLPPPMFA